MNSTTLIWIVVGIIVVLVIVGIVIALVATARGRREHRVQAQHAKAEEMRNDARETAIKAQQHEAEAARARADAAAAAAAAEDAKARAAQASVDAQRRAGTIDDHRSEAQDLRRQEAEQRRKADQVDPYVDENGRRTDASPGRADAADRDTARRDATGAPDRTDAPADRDTASTGRTTAPDPAVEQRDDVTDTPPVTRRTR